MMTFPIFVIMQKWNTVFTDHLSRRDLLKFGIYLCHLVFVEIAYGVFAQIKPLSVIVHILDMACSAFLSSYLIARTMSHFKLTRRFICRASYKESQC